MKFFTFFASIVAAGSVHASTLTPMTLNEAESLIASPTAPVSESLKQAPERYDFVTTEGKSSVHYSGQVHRNVLIHDLKPYMGSYRRGQTSADKVRDKLMGLYNYKIETTGFDNFLVSAKKLDGQKALIYEGINYASIADGSKNLRSKMAGVDNALSGGTFVGWTSDEISGVKVDINGDGTLMPDELFTAMVEAVAKNASEGESFIVANGTTNQTIDGAHITTEGLDLAQMGQKLIHGAVAFSQAAEDYLSVTLGPNKGLQADNAKLKADFNYTAAQHHWDEAFGYFGAARNFLEYKDIDVARKLSIDAYTSQDVISATGDFLYIEQSGAAGDGQISLMAEKNLGLSVNAGKRDIGAKGQDEDFTRRIMEAFLKGRHLLQAQPEGYRKFAQAYGIVALHQWERLFAATTIHYINKTLKDYKAYGTEKYSFPVLAKHYGELKGFALAFQFNPNSVMTRAEFLELHRLVRDFPVRADQENTKAYEADLVKARELLTRVYKVSKVTAENW